MNRVAVISTVIMGVGFAHGALAADLPVRAAPVYQAPVVVAPAWTGLYVGANGGWGWASNFNASSTFTDPTGVTAISPATSNPNAAGAVFGGQLGTTRRLAIGCGASRVTSTVQISTSSITSVRPFLAGRRRSPLRDHCAVLRQRQLARQHSRPSRLCLGPRNDLRNGWWCLGEC